MTVLAVEIGPTRFAVIEVANDVGPERLEQIPVPAAAAWDALYELMLQVAAGREVTAVGIACGGPIDMATGVVAPAEVAEWQTGFTLVEAVEKAFPTAAVAMALDGVCLALAERHFGATTDVLDSLAVRIDDRVVGGVMIGGFMVVGRTGNAGHIGHVPVPGFDEPCGCGSRGCLDAVAGAPALLRWAAAQGWSGRTVDELVTAAGAQDPVAVAAVGRAGTALGGAIAAVAALLDIDRVVVGGPLIEAEQTLWKPVRSAIAKYARLPSLAGLRVVPSTLGDMGLLAGAGVLALTARRDS